MQGYFGKVIKRRSSERKLPILTTYLYLCMTLIRICMYSGYKLQLHIYIPHYNNYIHHYCYSQRTEVLHALGSEEEFHASMSIALPSERSTSTEECSVTLLDISMESESSNQQEGASFIQGYHSMYSLDSDAEGEDPEDGIDDQAQSPEPPECSYLSLLQLEGSADDDDDLQPTISSHVELQPTVTSHAELQPTVTSHAVIQEAQKWTGFCIYGDNVDKEFRPRHQTVSEQTKSMHMFQSFAQLDRINLAGVSDEPGHPTVINPLQLLPSAADKQSVLSRMAVMISRLAKCNATCTVYMYMHINQHMHTMQLHYISHSICNVF